MPVSAIPTPSTAGVNKDATVLGRLVSLDTALSLRLHTFFLSFVPHSLLITLEITGDGRFWLPISIAFLLYPTTTSPHLHIHPFIFALLFGFLLDLVVVGAIKYSVRRPRPLYNKDMHAVVSVDIWSFPSGHSSRVFFIACYFWLYDIGTMGLKLTDGLYGDGDSLIKMGVLVWAVVTSCSRVLLGRHFVVDVVAGAVLGVFQGLFVFYLFKSWVWFLWCYFFSLLIYDFCIINSLIQEWINVQYYISITTD